jgi:hypothetical protein
MDLDLSYEENGGRGLVVVSFDPGETTGWAVHRLDLDSLKSSGFASTIYGAASGFCVGQIRGDGTDAAEFAMVDVMMDIVRAAYCLGDYSTGDLFAIVMEDFVLRRSESSRSLLAPVRVFSRFETMLYLVGRDSGVCLPYVKQGASDAKTIVTDLRLRRWNVYDSGSGVHARDAQRHGILFARKVASVPKVEAGLRSAVARTLSAVGA